MHRRSRDRGIGRCCARIALGLLSLPFAANAADVALAVDGPPIAVATGKPGQPLRLAFRAQAGQRLGLGVTALGFAPASATGIGFTVKRPDGQALPGLEYLHCVPAGAEGACDGEFTVATSGTHVIDVDVPFSAAPRFSIQLSSAVSRPLAVGKDESAALARPGQDGWFALAVEAGQDVAVALRDVVSGDREARFALRVHRPDGTVLGQAGANARMGASVSLGSSAPAGTYRIEVDPDRGATGSFVVVAKAAAKAADGPIDIASGVNEELRFAFDAGDGEGMSVGIENLAHTPDVDSNSRLLVLNPDGTQLNGTGCTSPTRGRPYPCKLEVAGLKAGRYTIVVAPPPGAAVGGRLHQSKSVVAKLEPGSPNRIELSKAGQVGRFTFEAKAGESVKVAIARNIPDDRTPLTVKLVSPNGMMMRMLAPGQAGAEFTTSPLPAAGTHTLIVDAGFRTASLTVSLSR
jgi:hypothetical protein